MTELEVPPSSVERFKKARSASILDHPATELYVLAEECNGRSLTSADLRDLATDVGRRELKALRALIRAIATPVVIAVLERWSADLMRDGFDAPAHNMLAEIARLEGGAP